MCALLSFLEGKNVVVLYSLLVATLYTYNILQLEHQNLTLHKLFDEQRIKWSLAGCSSLFNRLKPDYMH